MGNSSTINVMQAADREIIRLKASPCYLILGKSMLKMFLSQSRQLHWGIFVNFIRADYSIMILLSDAKNGIHRHTQALYHWAIPSRPCYVFLEIHTEPTDIYPWATSAIFFTLQDGLSAIPRMILKLLSSCLNFLHRWN